MIDFLRHHRAASSSHTRQGILAFRHLTPNPGVPQSLRFGLNQNFSPFDQCPITHSIFHRYLMLRCRYKHSSNTRLGSQTRQCSFNSAPETLPTLVTTIAKDERRPNRSYAESCFNTERGTDLKRTLYQNTLVSEETCAVFHLSCQKCENQPSVIVWFRKIV